MPEAFLTPHVPSLPRRHEELLVKFKQGSIHGSHVPIISKLPQGYQSESSTPHVKVTGHADRC